MPYDRSRYPDDWDEIAFKVKEDADWTCEFCGKSLRRPGEPFDTHRRTATVAHLDHDPMHCTRDNLRCLCPACHLAYDAGHHAETRIQRGTDQMRFEL